ncbi:uncharacterized protein LOC115719815 [Cannabis sativa]|uniref:uncharacterized protein LOC115719815 n=1 Tax=Cannabis sativa TaxID=3483 RepID=UPI0011DFC65E|nr:uncharacterized protein LOC115719815 [Cannabis sativa]
MFNLASPATIEDDEPLFYDETEYPISTTENTVQISYETLMNINNTEALITIQDMFAAVYFPSFSFIIDEIIDCGRKMMNNNNLNEEVGVDVYVHVFVNELPQLDWDDDDDGDDDYNMDDFPICFVASSEESIEKLEKVQVKDNPIFCSICLEDVSVGSEATKLPCTHAYHKQCVVEWLQVSKFCPNCRVEIV